MEIEWENLLISEEMFGFEVDRDGYVELSQDQIQPNLYAEDKIKMEFVPRDADDAVLLWKGDATNHLFLASK